MRLISDEGGRVPVYRHLRRHEGTTISHGQHSKKGTAAWDESELVVEPGESHARDVRVHSFGVGRLRLRSSYTPTSTIRGVRGTPVRHKVGRQLQSMILWSEYHRAHPGRRRPPLQDKNERRDNVFIKGTAPRQAPPRPRGLRKPPGKQPIPVRQEPPPSPKP